MNTISSLHDDDIILVLDNDNLYKAPLNKLSDVFYTYNTFIKLNNKLDDLNSYLASLSSDFFNSHLMLDEAIDIYANKKSFNDILNDENNLKKNDTYLNDLITKYATKDYVQLLSAWQYCMNRGQGDVITDDPIGANKWPGSESHSDINSGFEDLALTLMGLINVDDPREELENSAKPSNYYKEHQIKLTKISEYKFNYPEFRTIK